MKFQVGDWTVHEKANLLLNGSAREKLERRAMAVLAHLARHAGEVVSKDELIEAVWGGQAVSDHSVAIVISDLRRAFGDDRHTPTYIETIPKRGYRLIAPVRHIQNVSSEPSNTREPAIGRRPHQRLAATGLALAALLVLIAFAFGLIRRSDPATPSVVIADFENATGRGDLDYIAHAVNEMLTIDLLDHLDGGIVRWRDNALHGGESAKLVKEMLKKGGDAKMLTGRLIMDGEEPLLAVQLTDLDTGAVLWGATYSFRSAGFVPTSKEIARDIAATIGAPLSEDVQSAVSPEAYELYWRARYLWSLREQNAIRQAIELLTRLLAIDPDFAPAHAALADIYAHKTAEELGLDRLDTFAQAARHLERARVLSPDMSELSVTEAILSFYRDRDSQAALANVRRALGADPNNGLAWQTKAMILSSLGRHDESLRAIEQAQALDPLSASILWDKVWFLYIGGESRDALAAADAAQRVSAPSHLYYALIYDALGDDELALEAWVARARQRGLRADNAKEATGAATVGATGAYAAFLQVALADVQYDEFDIPLAILTLRAGDREGAIKILEDADPRHHNWWWIWLHEIPALATLREDPRVSAIISSLGLTQ